MQYEMVQDGFFNLLSALGSGRTLSTAKRLKGHVWNILYGVLAGTQFGDQPPKSSQVRECLLHFL